MAGLDDERASQAAAELVRTAILRPGAPLAFVHPVVQADVYAMLTPAEHNRSTRLADRSTAMPQAPLG